jgi:hypothetical protein
VGGRYALPPGEIEVVSLRGIGSRQITSQLARRSGFDSVEDLLAVAQHGEGEFVFLVEFVYRHSPSSEVRSSRGRPSWKALCAISTGTRSATRARRSCAGRRAWKTEAACRRLPDLES